MAGLNCTPGRKTDTYLVAYKFPLNFLSLIPILTSLVSVSPAMIIILYFEEFHKSSKFQTNWITNSRVGLQSRNYNIRGVNKTERKISKVPPVDEQTKSNFAKNFSGSWSLVSKSLAPNRSLGYLSPLAPAKIPLPSLRGTRRIIARRRRAGAYAR